MIPYGRQSIDEADIEAVVRVLRSDLITQGPVVPAFEAAVAKYCGAAAGVAVNSATSALHIACKALDVGAGDRVWTSPITFVASANCARYCGASVDFVDIDAATLNVSTAALESKLVEADRLGALPKVVIPVHFTGEPCDMPAIHALASRYGFRVIEDASHAIGAQVREDRVGNCRYSDITVFSFHPVKIITTGEGGVATTNDPLLAERMTRLRSHGITRDPRRMEGGSTGPWDYHQIELGFNYRITDIQAALGLSQMGRLDEFVARRHALAERYDRLLAGMPIGLPYRNPRNRSALHLYPIQVTDTAERSRVFCEMIAAGIGVNVHYIPVYLQPDYRRLGFARGYCPAAEEYYRRAITLPMFAAMTEREQDTVVSALASAIR